MKIENVIEICKEVTSTLRDMDNEKKRKESSSNTSLIFPVKKQKRGDITRISEQEFRFLFIHKMLNKYKDIFYYSVETPTEKKYKFKGIETKKWDIDKEKYQSALIDLTIFSPKNNIYERILNIEFKYNHKESISKDIFKLMAEPINGVLIILLKNKNNKTLPHINDKLEDYHKLFVNKISNKKHLDVIINIIDTGETIHRIL